MTRIASLIVAALLVHAGPVFAQEESPAPAPESPGAVNVSLFADAYAALLSQKNGTGHPAHRAYNNSNGFSLSFLGSDITYDSQRFGATASLRFGPSVPIFYGSGFMAAQSLGFHNILQAFATIKASGALTVDFGQFGTVYGAEVAESWLNLNYTRGALYYAYQPFWHTGARINYQVNDEISLKALVVNGVNNMVDTSDLAYPSIGLQAAYATGPAAVILGYLGSLDRPSAEIFDHFVDLVASFNLDRLTVLFNGDLGMDLKNEMSGRDEMFWGVSLAARYGFTDAFGLALRGEFLNDKNEIFLGAKRLMTGTLTLDWKPFGSNLILRLDGRVEKANGGTIFYERDGDTTDTWFQGVLGVVVKSS